MDQHRRFSLSQGHQSITFLLVCFLLFINGDQIAAQPQNVDCVPGQFRQRDRCLTCPRNTYSSIAEAPRCENCPDGLVTNRGATGRELCTVCAAGRFLDNTFLRPYCALCPSNTFNDMRNGTCQPCPSGSVSARGSKQLSDCVTCSGSTRLEILFTRRIPRCRACGRGAGALSPNSMVCGVCPAGTSRPRRISECTQCPPGTVSGPGANVCEVCPMGSFQNLPGQPSCQNCPAGSVTAQSQAACRIMCNGLPRNPSCPDNFCPPGKELTKDGKGCRNCPAGKFNPFNSTTPCVMCPDEALKVNSERTGCVCEDGFGIGARGKCTECRLGTMSDGNGSRCECILNGVTGRVCECPPLSRQIGDVCVPCNPATTPDCRRSCPDGQVLNRYLRICQKCSNDSSCHLDPNCRPCEGVPRPPPRDRRCPAGTELPSRGASTCVPCRPGFFKNLDMGSCRPCPIGTFNNETGAVTCEACPEGRRSLSVASTRCLNRCPPNATRSLAPRSNVPRITERCLCNNGFRDVGSGDQVICVRIRE